MTDFTPIASAIITLLATVITAFVIPMIRARLTNEKLAEVQLWVTVAVKAAEQLFRGHDQGQAKKQFVVDSLAKHGFTIDADQLDQMIEAAVNELPKLLAPTTEKSQPDQ